MSYLTRAPRYVEVRDEMPYGMTLKVLKGILRDELVEKIDASSSRIERPWAASARGKA